MRQILIAIVVGLFVAPVSPGQAQWVEPPGTGWVELQLSHQDTDRRFNHLGETEPLFNEEARSITTTIRLSGALGLWRGLDVWVDAPYHRLAFNDVVQDRRSTGLGDPRVFLRMGPSLFGLNDLPLSFALRGGVKFPVGDFPIDPDIVPLTEGQRDWEVLVEVGKSLHPWPVYVMGWAGYRWREENTQIQRRPGDERLLYVAAGGSFAFLHWKIAVDGLFGHPPVRTDFGLVLENNRRELVQLLPTLGGTLGPGIVEIGARLPLHGRNLPAGPSVTLGYFLTWDQPVWK